MARKGTGYFDRKGNFFRNGRDATISDLACMLGQIGGGDGMATGIAQMVLERREEIERLYAEHDMMMADESIAPSEAGADVTDLDDKVAKLPSRTAG